MDTRIIYHNLPLFAFDVVLTSTDLVQSVEVKTTSKVATMETWIIYDNSRLSFALT